MRLLAFGSLLLFVLVPAATSQRPTRLPGLRDLERFETAHPTEPPMEFPRHFDTTQLQRDASQLAQLAQSVPADVNQAAKGVFPKDMIEKLKKIEKLSKHLRTELTPR